MGLQCAKCGSGRIIPAARIIDHDHGGDRNLLTVVEKDPEAFLFKGRVFGQLLARICGACGYTELYTRNARQMYEAYRVARAGTGTAEDLPGKEKPPGTDLD